MEIFMWKVFLLNWINGCHFFPKMLENLDEFFIEDFFVQYLQKLKPEMSAKEAATNGQLKRFLRETFPEYQIKTDMNDYMIPGDYTYIYSLLLLHSFMVDNNKYFVNVQTELPKVVNNGLQNFLSQALRARSFPRKTLQFIISNVSSSKDERSALPEIPHTRKRSASPLRAVSAMHASTSLAVRNKVTDADIDEISQLMKKTRASEACATKVASAKSKYGASSYKQSNSGCIDLTANPFACKYISIKKDVVYFKKDTDKMETETLQTQFPYNFTPLKEFSIGAGANNTEAVIPTINQRCKIAPAKLLICKDNKDNYVNSIPKNSLSNTFGIQELQNIDFAGIVLPKEKLAYETSARYADNWYNKEFVENYMKASDKSNALNNELPNHAGINDELSNNDSPKEVSPRQDSTTENRKSSLQDLAHENIKKITKQDSNEEIFTACNSPKEDPNLADSTSKIVTRKSKKCGKSTPKNVTQKNNKKITEQDSEQTHKITPKMMKKAKSAKISVENSNSGTLTDSLSMNSANGNLGSPTANKKASPNVTYTCKESPTKISIIMNLTLTDSAHVDAKVGNSKVDVSCMTFSDEDFDNIVNKNYEKSVSEGMVNKNCEKSVNEGMVLQNLECKSSPVSDANHTDLIDVANSDAFFNTETEVNKDLKENLFGEHEKSDFICFPKNELWNIYKFVIGKQMNHNKNTPFKLDKLVEKLKVEFECLQDYKNNHLIQLDLALKEYIAENNVLKEKLLMSMKTNKNQQEAIEDLTNCLNETHWFIMENDSEELQLMPQIKEIRRTYSSNSLLSSLKNDPSLEHLLEADELEVKAEELGGELKDGQPKQESSIERKSSLGATPKLKNFEKIKKQITSKIPLACAKNAKSNDTKEKEKFE